MITFKFIQLIFTGLILGLIMYATIALGQDGVPTQGYESNGQNPEEYTHEEAEAAAVIVDFVKATTDHNLETLMLLVDDDIIFRSDPVGQIERGAQSFCEEYGFVRDPNSFIRLDELYVVGGPLDTLVLYKRTDINQRAGQGVFGGYPVEVAVLGRVSNGLITEWYDAPVNQIGGLANTSDGAATRPPRGRPIPDVCLQYPIARRPTLLPPVLEVPDTEALSFGTMKPEQWWNTEEKQSAQTVRAWFAAWQAGDPLLLGSFVDQNVIFRTDADSDIFYGRDKLLQTVCGTIGGRKRLLELYPVGADFDTLVLTESVRTDGSRIASFFRVQNSLITEWMDVMVESSTSTAGSNQNSEACQEVNAAFAG